MEKISRIIAPSARTKSYDVSRAQPARPGAPTIGRPADMDFIQDRITLSEQLLDPILNGETYQPSKPTTPEIYGPKENAKAQLVKEMTNTFFLKQNPKEVAKEGGRPHSEEVASRVQSSTGSSVNPESSKDVSL